MAKSFVTRPVVLRRVLSRLNQAGLIESKRCTNGGNVLARKTSAINLREVYESVCLTPEIFARHPEGSGKVSRILG